MQGDFLVEQARFGPACQLLRFTNSSRRAQICCGQRPFGEKALARKLPYNGNNNKFYAFSPNGR